LSIKIIADENIDDLIIKSLRDEQYYILSIKESHRGIKDYEIIQLANQSQCLILTEDKDFGEWIFSHGIISVGIIFLRYSELDKLAIIHSLLKLIKDHEDTLLKKFTVVTKNKIRIREI
jgi:predicted nuclease of predicted toxin-antitoxin system